ncbi:hypothetical protein RM549_04875 [Salegentibacter sp. F188]|uniref:Uncharacterized protein n=1 Tax=Autumnicola patrickiae TaxID=3075591 RepID=A0ABU3DZD3_9FLAO|nr:hypothetical protein [Salegentibacter sp. F188]MDT0689105.1 hypothetical protein [Salegentibacter sp. F188]
MPKIAILNASLYSFSEEQNFRILLKNQHPRKTDTYHFEASLKLSQETGEKNQEV